MKKIISIMLILASLASFASCGNNNNGSDSTDTSTGDTSTADTSTTGDTTAADTTKADESASTTTVSAADIGKAVADEFGDDYIPDMDIPADYLDSTYGSKARVVRRFLRSDADDKRQRRHLHRRQGKGRQGLRRRKSPERLRRLLQERRPEIPEGTSPKSTPAASTPKATTSSS